MGRKSKRCYLNKESAKSKLRAKSGRFISQNELLLLEQSEIINENAMSSDELNDEGGETGFGNDVWRELPQTVDENDVEDEEVVSLYLTVQSTKQLSFAYTDSFRPTGHNTDVRGAGTSKATYYKTLTKLAKKVEDAKSTHKMTSYYVRIERRQNVQQNDNPGEAGELHEEERAFQDIVNNILQAAQTIDTKKFTVLTAVEHLSSNEASVTMNSNDMKNKMKTQDLWQTKIAMALLYYFNLLKNRQPKMEASGKAAEVFFQKENGISSYKAACIRRWGEFYLRTGLLPTHRQGQHSKSDFVISEEHVQTSLKAYLRGLKNDERTPAKFKEDLNTFILFMIPGAQESVCEETARRWMQYLNFKPTECKKGYYTDDHNRADVVHYRENFFLPKMAEYERLMSQYSGNNMEIVTTPGLVDDEKEVVLITHDESTFYSNDGKRFIWMENGKNVMKPKSKGSSIMVSGLLCECHGFLSMNGLQTYKLFEAGTHREGWFTCDDLVEQMHVVFPIFEHFHPSKLFDFLL